jgi:IS5 family transposase
MMRQAKAALEAAVHQLAGLEASAQRRAQRALDKLETFVPRVHQMIRQTRARVLRGITQSEGKLIRIFQPEAQILRRGKPHKPTEFGQLVIVQESDGGIVSDLRITDARHDSQVLVSTVERHNAIFERPPDLVATDRGFFSNAGVDAIEKLGVDQPVIPKPGHRSKSRIKYEKQRWFRRGRAWRAGGEARIGLLKHSYGMHCS